ncbi:complement regulator-acquiring protein [Borreliella bavariensis]
MNRIIYLSLNYEIQKIEILKEMLEKLNKNLLKKFSTQSFLH